MDFGGGIGAPFDVAVAGQDVIAGGFGAVDAVTDGTVAAIGRDGAGADPHDVGQVRQERADRGRVGEVFGEFGLTGERIGGPFEDILQRRCGARGGEQEIVEELRFAAGGPAGIKVGIAVGANAGRRAVAPRVEAGTTVVIGVGGAIEPFADGVFACGAAHPIGGGLGDIEEGVAEAHVFVMRPTGVAIVEDRD